jgi:peroxiredoxin
VEALLIHNRGSKYKKYKLSALIISAIAAATLIGVLLPSCHSMIPLAPDSERFAPTLVAPIQQKLPGVGTSVGDIAPDFKLTDLHGKVVHLSDCRGKPVLLNFWTYCDACKEEMPYIQSAYNNIDKTASGSVVLSVNVTQDPDQVQQFIEYYGLTFDILLDRWGTIASEYYVRQIPTTFFIDKNGVIQDVQAGKFNNSSMLIQKLAELAAR